MRLLGMFLVLLLVCFQANAEPIVNFQQSEGDIQEGEQFELTLTLSEPAQDEVKVYFDDEGDVGRRDFDLSSRKVKILEGATQATLVITANSDDDVEGDEELILSIRKVKRGEKGSQHTLRLVIRDVQESSGDEVSLPDTNHITSCDTYFTQVTVEYCVDRTVGSENPDILWFFHGAYGSERYWTRDFNGDVNPFRKQIRRRWDESRKGAPTVIVISLGRTWLLNDVNSTTGLPPTFELIADQVMPAIEAREGLNQGGERLLGGISMGGFNALQLYMRRPEMFARAAVIAPMMPVCDPHMESGALIFCIARDPHESKYFQAKGAHTLAAKFFPTSADWQEWEPIQMAPQYLDSSMPPLYITTGTRDEFAFYTKNEIFAEQADDQGVDVTWVPTDYLHGHYDADPLADFLLDN